MINKKEVILRVSRELFLKNGFKDVNVSDITKAAGVGVGTFYNYYPSKEELFLEIFVEENQKAKEAIIEVLDVNEKPKILMRSFIAHNKNIMNNNRILKEWYNSSISSVIRVYYQEKAETSLFIRDIFTQFLKKWKEEKTIRTDIDYEIILSIFDSVVYLENHQDDIGISNFEKMIETLADFFICGLVEQ